MQTNSRGTAVAPSHREKRKQELAYINEMKEFLGERDSREDPTWTEKDRDRFIEIWEKHHGKIGG